MTVASAGQIYTQNGLPYDNLLQYIIKSIKSVIVLTLCQNSPSPTKIVEQATQRNHNLILTAPFTINSSFPAGVRTITDMRLRVLVNSITSST